MFQAVVLNLLVFSNFIWAKLKTKIWDGES